MQVAASLHLVDNGVKIFKNGDLLIFFLFISINLICLDIIKIPCLMCKKSAYINGATVTVLFVSESFQSTIIKHFLAF